MAEAQYNTKNPAVKRILQEAKELQKSPADGVVAEPLEDNIFEWHFAICGPPDTEFEGGVYHGRIILPPDYPFKPPTFMLLTPNGRFETNTKICLSISQYHPEHWQPSWGVRTALTAMIAFMPTKPDGAIGGLEYTVDERRLLAAKSRLKPPHFGTEKRQACTNSAHERILAQAPPLPAATIELAAALGAGLKDLVISRDDKADSAKGSNSQPNGAVDEASAEAAPPAGPELAQLASAPASTQNGEVPQQAAVELRHRNAVAGSSSQQTVPSSDAPAPVVAIKGVKSVASTEDRVLTVLAVVLSLAIIALLLRKFIHERS
eukprot:jgi/Chlat1/3860/Chrsp26S04149